jgi:hypothetical protein
MASFPESVTNHINPSFEGLKIPVIVPPFNEREKISDNYNYMNNHDQDDPELTCMIEGCDAVGEEPIALLDDACLSDVDAYGEHDATAFASERDNFKNNERDDLIPVVVCGKHFDEIIEAYYSKSEPKNGVKITK